MHVPTRRRDFSLSRAQNAWLYGVRLLQWQYSEGLLDEPELFNWILGQFKYCLLRKSVAAGSDAGALTVRCPSVAPYRSAPVELLPLIMPLVLDFLLEMCQNAALARYDRTVAL